VGNITVHGDYPPTSVALWIGSTKVWQTADEADALPAINMLPLGYHPLYVQVCGEGTHSIHATFRIFGSLEYRRTLAAVGFWPKDRPDWFIAPWTPCSNSSMDQCML
jgi:hypothetical protein